MGEGELPQKYVLPGQMCRRREVVVMEIVHSVKRKKRSTCRAAAGTNGNCALKGSVPAVSPRC